MNPSTEEAFVELIEQHKRLIYKACFLYAGNYTEQQDLFQEVTLNLWRAFPRFRGECGVPTWVYRIALNTCISTLRRGRSRPVAVPFAPHIDPYEENDENAPLAELYRLINQLGVLEKSLVFLYLEERSYEEIAQIMGISRTNVGVRLLRIKEKLKAMPRS